MRILTATLAAATLALAASAQAAEITLHYLRQEAAPPPTLSNLDPIPEDLGMAGARLGLADNATTGQFMGQTWRLEVTSVPEGGDFAAALATALGQTPYVLLDAPAEMLLAAADDPQAADALLFNVSAPDDSLRDADCRANLLHTLPSRAMLADALSQFLVSRRWTHLALIEGEGPGDAESARALTRATAKFGLEITARKTWSFDADMRRSAASEVPLFTQDLGDYDVLLVADDRNDFARYIPFNTWHPRPVAGAEGLIAAAWSPVVEAWGAAQLQSRFNDEAARDMAPVDYAAWAAVRAVGEAVTRSGATDPDSLRAYLLSEAFELAGFKGRPLTFRDWNGQLRQPIPLTHRGALVADAPLEGFLHQVNELDTLGLDRPETACTAFAD